MGKVLYRIPDLSFGIRSVDPNGELLKLMGEQRNDFSSFVLSENHGKMGRDGWWCSSLSSSYNADGQLVEQYTKVWNVFGMSIQYEIHGDMCCCSYCKTFDGRWGIAFPDCPVWYSWRILWWRKKTWPCRLSCIRWTLPKLSLKNR